MLVVLEFEFPHSWFVYALFLQLVVLGHIALHFHLFHSRMSSLYGHGLTYHKCNNTESGFLVSTSTLIHRNIFVKTFDSNIGSISSRLPNTFPIFFAFFYVILSSGKPWICTKKAKCLRSISCRLFPINHSLRIMWYPLKLHGLWLKIRFSSCGLENVNRKGFWSKSSMVSPEIKFQTPLLLYGMCTYSESLIRQAYRLEHDLRFPLQLLYLTLV